MGIYLKEAVLYPTPSMRFDPSWDGDANCYAYALNNPALGGRAPGDLNRERGAWLRQPPHNPPEWVEAALLRDGLVRATRRDLKDRHQHLIAAFAAPYFFDFHFYRRDADGTWSHKQGARKPVNLTEQFGAIRNPQKATDEKKYKFIGYYRLPEEGVPALVF